MNREVRTGVFLATLLISCLPLAALTVDEAVSQAKSHNLALAAETLKVDQKEAERTFSFQRLYPSMTGNALVSRLDTLSVGTGLGEEYHWNLSWGLSVQFLWSPAVFRGIAQTMIDYENAALSRAAAEARLERDVRKAFAQLLALQEATQVLEAQLQVAEERWKLARVNYDAGLTSEIALLQAQVAYENRKPPLADQRLNEESARAAFRILLNLPEDQPLVLVGDLATAVGQSDLFLALDAEALVEAWLEGRFDLALAQGTARSLENATALQADTLWPSLVLGYTADPTVNRPFQNDRWKDGSLYAQRSGGVSLGLSWKLDGWIPGSATGLEIAGRSRQAEQARLNAEQVKRVGAAEIRTLVGRLKKSASSLAGLQLALTLASRSAKLTEAGYRAGNQSFNETQDADLQLQSTRLQVLNEELALSSTLAELDYALAAHREQWLGDGRG